MSQAAATGPRLARLKPREVGAIDEEPPGRLLLIRDTADGDRAYALKVFDLADEDDPEAAVEAIARARASALASPKVNHPALLAYHDFRPRRSWFRLAGAELLMAYVDGRSLDLLERDRVSVGQWALVFKEVASALAHLHRRKVLHGDLKPRHVMVARGGKVKVLGYGLSLVPDDSKPRGTQRYMAPEQLKENALTEKTDLYNLGALMYECLTGRPAGNDRPAEGAGRRTDLDAPRPSTPAALNPAVPAKLNNLIVGCLHSQPARRPAGAYEVMQALEAIVADFQVEDPEEALTTLAVGE